MTALLYRARRPLADRATRWAATAALALAACGAKPQPTSVLLVTLDTTRADALGCYGNPAGVTPNLDALAREGVLYDAARTVAPLTLPAHSSMLTGLYPPRHGVADNGYRPLPETAVTIAESARAAGVQTAAFVAAVVLDPAFGLAQGFEVYEAPPRHGVGAERVEELPAYAMVAKATAWLARRDRDRPFFLWLHLFDAHAPYKPTEELKARAQGSAYLGEVAAIDIALGKLFAAMRADGTLDHTLVIVVGDHGESLGQHGESTHGFFVYDATLRVPLIVRHPDGARAGERSSEIVSVVDVCPTALTALGLAVPPGIDGVDLARGRAAPDRGVYFESYNPFLNFDWSPLAGWIDAHGKFIQSPHPEFFDPLADRLEKRNLAAERAPDLERGRRAIAEVWAHPPLADPSAKPLDASLRQGLRSLGYTGVEASGERLPSPLETGALPDPNERKEELKAIYGALDLAFFGKYDEAIAAMEKLHEEMPQSTLVTGELADYLVKRARYAEARKLLEALAARGAARAGALNTLGVCCEQMGERELALGWYARALELDAGLAEARANVERLRAAPVR